MNVSFFISQLNKNAERIAALVADIPDEQARWKPDSDSWSILEVLNHLYDEEREDFRVRLDIIWYRPDEPWPPIDPEGWVGERKYNQRDLQVSLRNFLAERKDSLAWLESLGALNWDIDYTSPFGSILAGDMVASWVTHDQLHMRQLVELHRAYTELQAGPYRMDYAGQW